MGVIKNYFGTRTRLGCMEPEDLKKKYLNNHKWSEYSAYILIIGLIIEVFLPDMGESNFWIKLPTIIVALAVCGEVVFSRRAHNISEDLQKIWEKEVIETKRQTAEAIERATKLEKEITDARLKILELEKELDHVRPAAALALYNLAH
jgi:hypothetical protein